MATLFHVDPKNVYLICYYWQNGKYYTHSGPLTAFPATSAAVRSMPMMYGTEQYLDRYTDKFLFSSFYDKSGPSDPEKLTSESKVEVELLREPHPNPKFRDRQRAGEIVLAPYKVAKATLTTRTAVDINLCPTVRTKNSSFYDLIRFPDLQPGFFQVLSAEVGRITECRVSVMREVKTIKQDSPVVRSPSITLDRFDPPFEIVDRLVTQALADAKGAVYDVLTELAELPQTVAYLGDKVTEAAKIATEHKSRAKLVRKLPIAKQATALADLQLQFRYAIMPIMYSIQAIRSLLGEYGTEYRESRATEEFDLEDPVGSPFYKGCEGGGKHRAFIKAAYDPATVLEQLWLLIGPNPISTLWELTPWSFVLDWAVNIGDWLAALTGIDVSDQMVACASTKVDASFNYRSTDSGPETTLRLESYVRKPINPYDHIGLSVYPAMTWLRWLDAFALSWQKVRPFFK